MASTTLQDCLSGLDPALLRKLSADDLTRLQALLKRERDARASEYDVAIEAVVAQAPALLRSTLQRILTE